MNVVASLLLRAKHWQIFFLLFGIFIVGDVAVMSSMSAARSPQDFVKIGPLFGAVLVLSMFCILAWFWSMGSFLSSMVPPPLRPKLGFFRFALTYPALYIFIFIASFQSASTRPALLAIIFPLHFLAVFCMFYDLYFVSKNLVLAETSKSASFYDYARPFFLIWVFPVGVWFIQPRINRLYRQPTPSLTQVESETPSAGVVMTTPTTGSDACGVSVETPTVYAGFWLRVAGALIDCAAMFIPLFLITFILIFMIRLISASKGYDSGLVILAVLPVVIMLAVWFYFAVLESAPWQATLGKMAVGLRVSDIQGHRLTLGRSMGRNLAKCLSTLSVGIGYMMCGFTKKKQSLHDMIASCLVLRRPRR